MFMITGRKAALAAMLLAVFAASPAHAYMGAGAGLSALGSIISFLGVFLLMAFGFVWFPLKRAIKRMRGKTADATIADSEAGSDA